MNRRAVFLNMRVQDPGRIGMEKGKKNDPSGYCLMDRPVGDCLKSANLGRRLTRQHKININRRPPLPFTGGVE